MTHTDPKPVCRIFRNSEGKLRLIWILAILVAVLLVWNYGIAYLWLWIFAKTDVWLTAVRGAGTLAIFLPIAKRLNRGEEEEKFPARRALAYTGLGAAAAILIMAICLIIDSLRLERPLTEPAFTWNILLAPILSYITVAASDVFILDCVFETTHRRVRTVWAILITMVVRTVIGALWQAEPVGIINTLLWTIAQCLICMRFGAPAALYAAFGWSCALSVLFKGTIASSLWSVYCVSEPLLTGEGDPFEGLLATALFVGVIVFLLLKRRKAE